VQQKKWDKNKRRFKGESPSLTSSHLRDLLPAFLSSLGEKYHDRPALICESWPQIVGDKIAKMTRAWKFDEGILHVTVQNSTLLSLLSQYDKPRLIAKLRGHFPQVEIKTVVFRLE
jgi:hypothetical protein